ncbi:MAG TPA: hypothetical protein VEP49_09080 [Acidimicrobiia bacterium]|nr:hypothetical protein [Acidimicrobiia bacterium]
MRNGATLIRPIPVWLLRIVWITLPLTAGPAAAAALRDWSDTPQLVGEVLLWLAWAAGLLATLAPRPETLTALRTIAPAFAVFAIAAAADGRPSASASIGAVTATVVAAALASGHDIAIAAANAIAYGDEQRVLLRVPPALFLAPIPVARALVVAVVVGGPLLLADGRTVPGVAVLVIGAPLVYLLVRALHGLSLRWTVLVPAGFVVVDRMTLADPVLFLRERIVAMSAVDPGPAPEGALDLRLGATLGSVVLWFDEEAELFRAVRRRRTDTVRTRGVCVAVVRRGELLRAAAARRLPVREG